MDLFWREHKRFILGVGAALLAGLLVYLFIIGPAREKAARARNDLRTVQQSLAQLLATRGQPTDDLLGRAREDLERIEKSVASVSSDIAFAMPREFRVPEREKSPGFFFDTLFNQVKSEMKRKAPKAGPDGVRLPADGKFGFTLAPDPKSAQEFLIRLALVNRLVQSAFDAPVLFKKAVVAEILGLQALPGAAQGAPIGPPPGTFIQRHPVEMQLRCDFSAFVALLHGFCQKGAFLAVERVRFVKEDQLAPHGVADFGVSGLTIQPDGALEGSAPGAEAGGGSGGGGRSIFRRGRG